MLIVGTRAHLEDLDRSYTYAEDVLVTAVAVSSFSGGVGSLLAGSARPTWSLLDGERIVLLDEFDMTFVTGLAGPKAQAMAAAAGGTLVVGLEGAHLVTVSPDGTVSELPAFDQVAGRESWSNPAGPTPELRSIAVSQSDVWYANVHVGGLWRSDDQGQSWRNVIAPESDVHEVVTGFGGTVAVAAAIGFGWSTDGGETWQWMTDGLHAGYARAVALDGETAFVTASTGPDTSDGRLFRCRLGASFEACGSGLPESFPFNLDTGSVAASGGHVALGTRNGHIFRSSDSGSSWELAAEGMRPVRVLRFN
ncbi:MAG: hypothetical protein ABSD85_01635 [Acidimicrobiales bacterium]|jgi:hypothetical protein